MDILQYIQRMNQLYGTDPVPVRYNTQQYLQGGRVGLKPGGLVEPGVTRYGKFTEAEKAANVQAYLEKSGDTLEKFNTYDLNKQSKIKNKIITGVGSGKYTERRTGQILSGDERWKLWTDKEPLFEEYVQTQMKKPTPDMKKVMDKYNLTADSSPKEFFKRMTEEYAEANKARRLTEAGTPTKSLISRQSYENFFQYGKKTTRHAFYDTFLPQRGTISVKEFLDQVPAMKGYKNPMGEFTKMVNEAGSEDALKRLDKGSEAFIRKRSKIKQGKDFIKALEAAGIEMVETRSSEYIARRIREGRPMEMSARRIKLPTIEQITAFSDSDYFKDTYRLDQNYKDKISKLSIEDPQYKVGGYGAHRTNLKQLQRVLNNKISSMSDAQLRAWVENNPSLKRMVEFDFNPLNGEIERIPLEKMDDSILRERVRIERDHIRGRSTVGYDKATNKILDGIDVEFPKNYQLQPKAINHVTKGNIERWVAQNSNETAKIKKLDDFFKSIDSSYWDINAKKYRGAPVKNISAYTEHLGIDMEQLLKSEEVFPAGHIRAGERIVERPNLLAKITKANSFDSFQDGIFKQAAKAGIGPNCKKFNVGGSYTKCMQNAIDNEVKLAKSGGKGAKTAAQKIGGVAKWAGKWFGLIDIPLEFAFALPSLVRGDIEGAKASTTFGLFGWGKTELEQMQERNPEAYKYMKHYDDTMNHFQLQWQKNDLEKKLEGFKTTGTYGQDVKNKMTEQLRSINEQLQSIQDNYIGYETPDEMNLGYQSLQKDIGVEGAKRQKDAWSVVKREDVDLPDTVAGHFMKQNLERSRGRFQTDPIIERLGLERDFILPDKPGASPMELEARYGKENLRKYYEDQRRFNLMNRGNIDPGVPFSKGGSVDKARRAFLKMIAALTGTAAVGATGLLKIVKGSKGVTAIKAGDKIIQGTPGMPDWYIPLINRIVKEGDDVTAKLATKEREIVHTKKIEGHDVDVYQNLDTGDIRVVVEGGTGKHLTAYDGGLELEYRAPEIIESGKYRGGKTNPDFNVAETEAGYYRTGPEDADLDISFNTQGRPTKYDKKSGTVVVDESKATTDGILSDTNFLKNYAKKKKSNMGEIVETTKKKQYNKHLDDNPHEDPRIPEGPEPDVGMDEFGNLVDDYGEIID